MTELTEYEYALLGTPLKELNKDKAALQAAFQARDKLDSINRERDVAGDE